MIETEKLKALYKHRNFLKIGAAMLSTGLTAALYSTMHLFHMDMSSVLGYSVASLTVGSVGLWAMTLTDSHFVTHKITNKMYENIKSNGLALFNKHVSKENMLTNENLETRTACMKFFEKIAFIDFAPYGFDSTDWREESVPNKALDNKQVQEIYKKEYKNQDIVGKQLIITLSKADTCYQQERELLFNLFKLQDNQFTQKDLVYIAQNFPQVASQEVMNFLAQREIFIQLGETIQSIILTQKDNKCLDNDNREKLLNYYSKGEEVKLANTQVKDFKKEVDIKENEVIVIKEDSFKTLLSTKKIMNQVYSDDSKMTEVLESIETLLLNKEKFLSYLDTKPNQYLEVHHFLKEDINNTIDTFNQEAQILNKMKLFSHEQLEEHKNIVLISITERMNMLNIQLNVYKEQIEKDLVDELGHSLEVNKKVLSSKMSG